MGYRLIMSGSTKSITMSPVFPIPPCHLEGDVDSGTGLTGTTSDSVQAVVLPRWLNTGPMIAGSSLRPRKLQRRLLNTVRKENPGAASAGRGSSMTTSVSLAGSVGSLSHRESASRVLCDYASSTCRVQVYDRKGRWRAKAT